MTTFLDFFLAAGAGVAATGAVLLTISSIALGLIDALDRRPTRRGLGAPSTRRGAR